MIGLGSRGNAVEGLQKQLHRLGFYRAKLDGDFGPITRQALMEFQLRYCLTGEAGQTELQLLGRAETLQQRRRDKFVPRGFKAITARYGDIEYTKMGGGRVLITNDWTKHNIARVELPIVGAHHVHKLLIDEFVSVLQSIEDAGLSHKIRQFGVWCPRHKMHDPRRGLSMHSWAIACDVNQSDNPPGAIGKMNPGIVDIFEDHGFTWGGRWRHRDDMHFEYCES